MVSPPSLPSTWRVTSQLNFGDEGVYKYQKEIIDVLHLLVEIEEEVWISRPHGLVERLLQDLSCFFHQFDVWVSGLIWRDHDGRFWRIGFSVKAYRHISFVEQRDVGELIDEPKIPCVARAALCKRHLVEAVDALVSLGGAAVLQGCSEEFSWYETLNSSTKPSPKF